MPEQIFGFNIIRKLQVERDDADKQEHQSKQEEDWLKQAKKLSNQKPTMKIGQVKRFSQFLMRQMNNQIKTKYIHKNVSTL